MVVRRRAAGAGAARLPMSFVLAAALLLTACGRPAPDRADRTVEYGATRFVDARPVLLSALRGRAVLLASWATWCAPCERELPRLERLAQERSAEGLQVVAVNIDPASLAAQDIAAMLERLGIDLDPPGAADADRHGIALAIWRDPDNRLGEQFGGFGVPFAVLIDRDGRVVERWNGALDPTGDAFVAALERALAD